MLAELNNLNAAEATSTQAAAAGKERIVLCGYCHGKDGNAVKPQVPNLAGQNPEYLLTQFEHFKTGVRKDFVMSQLARDLTDPEKINIAIYFSKQQVINKPSTNRPAIAKGEEHFQRICYACHGRDGLGQNDRPRLAGQPESYVVESLTRFKNKDIKRGNSVMLGIAPSLTDEEITDLAAYLSSL